MYRGAIVAVLLLLSACAAIPQPVVIVPPAKPNTTAVAVTMKFKEFMTPWLRKPQLVWFARISDVDGSRCLIDGDPRLGLVEPGAGTEAPPPGDSTCKMGKDGRLLWLPRLYPASLISDGTAYLVNVPPGRYAAVGAEMTFNEYDDFYRVFFSTELIDATTVTVHAGEARYMGSYVFSLSGSSGEWEWDDRQRFFQARSRPTHVSQAHGVAGAVAYLAADMKGRDIEDKPAVLQHVEPEAEARDQFVKALPDHLGAAPWVDAFASGVIPVGTAAEQHGGCSSPDPRFLAMSCFQEEGSVR